MKKVLWIEDDARFGLAQLAGPVYVHGGYDLMVASDISTAVARLERGRFDAVIADIRLPPGDNPAWQKLYQEAGGDKVHARLGLYLLYSLLGHPEAQVPLDRRPTWLTPDMIAVFTVESRPEIGKTLEQLKIGVYEQKRADLPDTILLDIIEKVLEPPSA